MANGLAIARPPGRYMIPSCRSAIGSSPHFLAAPTVALLQLPLSLQLLDAYRSFPDSEALVSFDLLLPRMAEKWREVPGGSDHHPRQFSDQLLQGPEADLSAAWSRQYEEAAGLHGWYWKLYGEILRGKRVLEINSGMGFDAVHLASQGAAMTCCDIAPANLEIVRRAARARGLDIETLHIDGIGAFDRLPRDFDAVW